MPTARLPIDAAHRAASSDAHAIGAVTGLTDALAGKAAVAHETALTGVHGIKVVNTTSVGLGSTALASVTSGTSNVGVGFDALRFLTSGGSNVAVGREALRKITTTSNNIGIGTNAMNQATTAFANIAIGSSALGGMLTGTYNIGIGGYAAGRFLADGTANETSNYCTYIGYSTRASVAGATNETAIGNGAIGGGSNTIRLGNASVTNWLPGATNVCALGNSTTAFKELYLHDGTDEWKVTINTSGVLTTTKV